MLVATVMCMGMFTTVAFAGDKDGCSQNNGDEHKAEWDRTDTHHEMKCYDCGEEIYEWEVHTFAGGFRSTYSHQEPKGGCDEQKCACGNKDNPNLSKDDGVTVRTRASPRSPKTSPAPPLPRLRTWLPPVTLSSTSPRATCLWPAFLG